MEFIPVINDVDEVSPHSSHSSQRQRFTNLIEKFEECYGSPPEYVSRSPGRVNIIGEHIDYMLFSVLPMAIEADILIAFRTIPGGKPSINLANTNQPKYPPREIHVPAQQDGDIEVDPSNHDWSNYFKAGYRYVLEHLRNKKAPDVILPQGMNIIVDGGGIPVAAGLSSSAAFVCASALTAMVSMGVQEIKKRELVTLATKGERYVGVNSGGMDQAASVLGVPGNALFISFSPKLDVENILLPKSSCFIIADSRRVAEKQKTAETQYNLRVVETTLAAHILAERLNLGPLPDEPAAPLGASLKGVMDLYLHSQNPSCVVNPAKMADIAKEILPEIIDRHDNLIANLATKFIARFPVRTKNNKFKIRSRAVHVFSEAARVLEARKLILSHNNHNNDHHDGIYKEEESQLVRLGTLMNQSHESCKTLYECSSDELDELCNLARSAGSYGSRLTGAGWGGSTVHLVPYHKIDAVRHTLMGQYYIKKFPEMSQADVQNAVVFTTAGSGSTLFKV